MKLALEEHRNRVASTMSRVGCSVRNSWYQGGRLSLQARAATPEQRDHACAYAIQIRQGKRIVGFTVALRAKRRNVRVLFWHIAQRSYRCLSP